MTGLSIEAATEHVEVAVIGPDGVLAHVAEDVGHGHTRRLTPLVMQALEEAGVAPGALRWVAADVGPGSFTGVRVGLATARAFALVAGARHVGASSLASLAHGSPARRALVVPLVCAGRLDVYAGFFRGGARGPVRLVAAPRVVRADALVELVKEAHALVPELAVRFVGPGAGRERARLEEAFPSSTAHAFRHDGLSAIDLARAAQLKLGPGAGLPADGHAFAPVYVRPAQAEERVRHAITDAIATTIRPMSVDDLPQVVETEHDVFSDPWSERFFRDLLERPETHARVAERDGRLAGYAITVLRPPVAEIENIATVAPERRSGVARALMDDALAACERAGVSELTLEVRVSNDGAQALYRGYGFRLAGLRPGYYRHPEEDALLMTRFLGSVGGGAQPARE